MQGQILQVDAERASGLILGADGDRYEFAFSEWKAASPPAAGVTVDYVASGGFARAVYPLPAAGTLHPAGLAYAPPPMQQQSNAPLLGGLGIAFLVLGFFIPVLPTIVAFILGLIGADAAKHSPDRRGLLRSRVAWIGAVLVLVAWAVLLAVGLSFLTVMFNAMFHELMKHSGGITV